MHSSPSRQSSLTESGGEEGVSQEKIWDYPVVGMSGFFKDVHSRYEYETNMINFGTNPNLNMKKVIRQTCYRYFFLLQCCG